jgi:putative transposase
MVAFIDANRDQYGVEPICAELPIAPSTYYEQKARERDQSRLPPRVHRDRALCPQIERVWRANFCAYGVRKTWKQMNREKIRVARCTVGRLMKDMGLRGVVRGKRYKAPPNELSATRPADLVERQFTASRPNQLWVANFTYVATWRGFVFVAVAVKDFLDSGLMITVRLTRRVSLASRRGPHRTRDVLPLAA